MTSRGAGSRPATLATPHGAPMPGYHEILLVPCTGHFGPGRYRPGPNYGHFFEMDIARDLLQVICDELDTDRIRFRVLKLWEAPGIPKDKLALEAPQNGISLHISFGREQLKPGQKNATKAWFSEPGAAWLARLLSESVSEWAKCGNFHHEGCNPKHQPDFYPGHAVLIEPFNLATDDPEPYVRRIKSLGHAMAFTISEFFRRTDQAVRWKPLGAWANEKREQDNGRDRALVSGFLAAVDSPQFQHLHAAAVAEGYGDFSERKAGPEGTAPRPPGQTPEEPHISSLAEPHSSTPTPPGSTDRPLNRGKGRRSDTAV